MKQFLTFVAVAMFCLAGSARGAGLSPDERAFFDKHISKIVQIEPTRMEGPALQTVFQSPLYKVIVTISQGDSGKQTVDLVVARVRQELADVSLPGTNEGMPQLQRMISPKFKLKNQQAAKTLEAALDALYPISDAFGGEDLKAKAIKHSGSDWLFIRGAFFKKHKGFVFKTNPDGTIAGVSYSLDLP